MAVVRPVCGRSLLSDLASSNLGLASHQVVNSGPTEPSRIRGDERIRESPPDGDINPTPWIPNRIRITNPHLAQEDRRFGSITTHASLTKDTPSNLPLGMTYTGGAGGGGVADDPPKRGKIPLPPVEDQGYN